MIRTHNLFVPTSKRMAVVQSFFLILTVYGFWSFDLASITVAIIFTFFYTILGVALTFHRVLSHNHYRFNKTIKKILILLASLANVGSPVTWVAVHRAHHKHCDTEDDPHSPNHLSAIYVLFFSMFSRVNMKFVRDLLRDDFCTFVHRNYYLIQIPWILLLYLIGGINLVIIAHVIPGCLTWLLGSFLNYLNHTQGYINFISNESSKNNLITGFLLFGEGWHNNHHKNPNAPSTRVNYFELDLIDVIARKILFAQTKF